MSVQEAPAQFVDALQFKVSDPCLVKIKKYSSDILNPEIGRASCRERV
jgi:hypothetical protein